MRGDHQQHLKSRRLAQPTKKLNCPVKFTVKKIYRFPEYKISKDNNWQRSNKSKDIKARLAYFKKDSKENLKFDIPGTLEYVTQFPSGIWGILSQGLLSCFYKKSRQFLKNGKGDVERRLVFF